MGKVSVLYITNYFKALFIFISVKLQFFLIFHINVSIVGYLFLPVYPREIHEHCIF